MKITFDPVKDQSNIAKHGLSLAAFELLDLTRAVFQEDKRQPYGEQRIQVLAPLDERLCTAVFTPRNGVWRVISVRKSNRRERKKYAEKTA
jgi:uncharacterized DUF497 family protein